MTRRWMIALLVSLGLNLFFAGFALARHWRRHDTTELERRSRHEWQRPSGAGDSVLEQLPWGPPAFRQLWHEHGAEFAPELRELRQMRQRVLEELRRGELDKTALEKSLGDLRRLTDALQQKLHRALVERAATLSTDERQKLAGSWQRTRGRRQRHAGEARRHEREESVPADVEADLQSQPRPDASR